jgi:hypothetical protein
MNREKKIPTILGLIVLLAGTVFGISATSRQTFFSQKASGNCDPKTLRITNINHYSANVSFITTADCLSSLSVDNRIFSDIRYVNLGISPKAGKVHYFEINSLKSNKQYPFYLIIDGKKYQKDEYSFSTAQEPNENIPTSNLAWGRVFNEDLTPASSSIVFLHVKGGSDLSSFVTSNGYWNVSLATSFNESLNNWFVPPENIEEDILVLSALDGSVTQIIGNTSNNNPVPDIIIGQNYFPEEPVGYKPSIGESVTSSEDENLINRSLTVDNPKESEVISTLKPDIFGYAPSNKDISIVYEDRNYQVTSVNDGSWHWYPPQNMTIGQNQIKVMYEDQTVIRNFSIDINFGMAFTSTPSAYTSPTSTPTPTSTPVATPTSTPTSIITPTPIPTVITATPTQIIRTSKPSTQSGVPVTGNLTPTIILIISSISFGLFFYIAKKEEK